MEMAKESFIKASVRRNQLKTTRKQWYQHRALRNPYRNPIKNHMKLHTMIPISSDPLKGTHKRTSMSVCLFIMCKFKDQLVFHLRTSILTVNTVIVLSQEVTNMNSKVNVYQHIMCKHRDWVVYLLGTVEQLATTTTKLYQESPIKNIEMNVFQYIMHTDRIVFLHEALEL